MPGHEWESLFCTALNKRNVPELLKVLRGLSTAHGKTPKAAVKNKALSIIQKTLIDHMKEKYELAVFLAESEDDTGHELAAHLLADLYLYNPHEVTRYLHTIADSENWEVREWAAGACGSVLVSHFNLFYDTMKDWVGDPLPNVRRAVVVAVKYAAKDLDESHADRLISLIEPLLPDRDPYVRKNLGAFAIGDGLLKYYPEHTIARVQAWAVSDNEQTQWNTAMIFTSAAAVKHHLVAGGILQHLEEDSGAYVKRAVQKATKLLEKRAK